MCGDPNNFAAVVGLFMIGAVVAAATHKTSEDKPSKRWVCGWWFWVVLTIGPLFSTLWFGAVL